MKLNDKYSIEQDGSGFVLIEKTVIEITKDRKKTGKFKDGTKKRFYGTVYQALQGFLSASINDSSDSNLEDIHYIVQKAILEIIEAEENIKSLFCVEVITVKP